MRDILVTFIVFVGLIYTLRKPYIGILVWSWLGYMNPHRLAYGFAYTAPFAQFVAIVTMLSMLFSKEKKVFPVNSLTIIWIIFIIYMGIGTIFALFPEDALLQLIKVYKIQLVVFLTLLLINTKERINQLIWTIALSIGFYGIKGGLFTLLTGGGYKVWGPSGSYIEGNNELGLAVLIIIPLFIYLRMQAENKWLKWGLFIAIGLSTIMVLGTYSRGAFLALFCMAFFLWLKMPNKIITMIVGSILLSIALLFMPAKFYDRMNTIETYEEDASAMGRINAWTVAINLANDRFFAGGYNHWSKETFAQYAPVPDDVHDAHSIYFEVLGEQGYMGLLLFFTIFFLSWRYLAKIIHSTKEHKELSWANDLARILQVSLIAYASGGAFLGLGYWDLPYHLMAITVLLKQLIDAKQEEKIIVKKEENSIENKIIKKKWAWEK